MNLNLGMSPWNIFNEENKKEAIKYFDQWRVKTQTQFTEDGQYNPNKAFVWFLAKFWINFELDYEHLQAINDLARLIKGQHKIDNEENFQTSFSIESFESLLQATVDVQELQPIFEKISVDYKKLFTIKGVYRPDDAFLLTVLNRIPTLVEINELAKMLNAREGIEEADRLAAPYSYGDVWRILGKKMVNRQQLQKTVEKFDVWRREPKNRKRYFIGGYYDPNAALLGFLKEKVQFGEDGLDNYGQFCVFAEMLKEQKKIDNLDRLKNPPCSYNAFDKVYRSMFVRSNLVCPGVPEFMLYVAMPLYVLFLLCIVVRSFNKSLDSLTIKDVTTDWTPIEQSNLLMHGPYGGPFQEILRCMEQSGCSHADLNHTINYDENPLTSWSDDYYDTYFSPRNANITIYQDHHENNCSAITLFYCAEQNRFNVTGLAKPRPPLLMTNGEVESCADEEGNCEFDGVTQYKINP